MAQSMKGKTAMMPLNLPLPADNLVLGKVQLLADLAAGSLRPWLCLAEAHVCSWGSLRFPLAGVPCCIAALDDSISVTVAPMESLLKAQVRLDVMGEWGKDERIDAFVTYVLRRGDMVFVPFGWVCLWT